MYLLYYVQFILAQYNLGMISCLPFFSFNNVPCGLEHRDFYVCFFFDMLAILSDVILSSGHFWDIHNILSNSTRCHRFKKQNKCS